MVKKLKTIAGGAGDKQFAQTVKDSAQQIWLAGLGAFVKAQAEGMKAFNTLVKEGETPPVLACPAISATSRKPASPATP